MVPTRGASSRCAQHHAGAGAEGAGSVEGLEERHHPLSLRRVG
jgi:hypothetical protein